MLEIILSFTSHYLPGEWNEIHPGLRYENAPFMGAFFVNSEGNPSLAVGLHGNSGPLFGEAGIATGYSGGTVIPFIRAGVEYDSFRLFAGPAMNTDGDFGAVVGLELILTRF